MLLALTLLLHFDEKSSETLAKPKCGKIRRYQPHVLKIDNMCTIHYSVTRETVTKLGACPRIDREWLYMYMYMYMYMYGGSAEGPAI